jgi:hypothetical protein
VKDLCILFVAAAFICLFKHPALFIAIYFYGLLAFWGLQLLNYLISPANSEETPQCFDDPKPSKPMTTFEKVETVIGIVALTGVLILGVAAWIGTHG